MAMPERARWKLLSPLLDELLDLNLRDRHRRLGQLCARNGLLADEIKALLNAASYAEASHFMSVNANPPDEPVASLAGNLRTQIATLYVRATYFVKAQRLLLQARADARDGLDPATQAGIECLIAYLHLANRAFAMDSAGPHGAAAWQQPDAGSDARLLGECLSEGGQGDEMRDANPGALDEAAPPLYRNVGVLLDAPGRPLGSLEASQQVLDIARGWAPGLPASAATDSNSIAIRALALLARTEQRLGELDAAQSHAQRAVRQARHTKIGFAHSEWLGSALVAQGIVQHARGERTEAQASWREALIELRDTVGEWAPATAELRSLMAMSSERWTSRTRRARCGLPQQTRRLRVARTHEPCARRCPNPVGARVAGGCIDEVDSAIDVDRQAHRAHAPGNLNGAVAEAAAQVKHAIAGPRRVARKRLIAVPGLSFDQQMLEAAELVEQDRVPRLDDAVVFFQSWW